jgi:hypothetical protein
MDQPEFRPASPPKSHVTDVAIGVFLGLWLFTITLALGAAALLIVFGHAIRTTGQ